MSVVGAHFYVGDASAEELKTIPSNWYYTRFDAVDILYIGPLVSRRTDHLFSLQYINDHNESIDYSTRFERVIKRARSQNPQIKIIASQWWGDKNVLADLKSSREETTISPETTSRIEKYTDSVRDFLAAWQPKTSVHKGKTISLRVDGCDVDYEVGNREDIVPSVYEKLRAKVDKYAGDHRIAPFLLTLTPDRTFLVKEIAPFVNYINMQNYDGGRNDTADEYVARISSSSPSTKLIWGTTAENTTLNMPNSSGDGVMSIDDQLAEVSRLHLGGLFIWRLSSDNWTFENAVQVYVWNKLHPQATKTALPNLDANVHKGWERGGRDANGKLTSPFTGEEWRAAHPGLKPPPS